MNAYPISSGFFCWKCGLRFGANPEHNVHCPNCHLLVARAGGCLWLERAAWCPTCKWQYGILEQKGHKPVCPCCHTSPDGEKESAPKDLVPLPWQPTGSNPENIAAQLKGILGEGKTITWGESPVIGFPTMAPDSDGVAAHAFAQTKHINNILVHTSGKGEKGFEGGGTLEQWVIQMVASLMGDPCADGYITPGGTEANIQGLWIGRNRLAGAKAQFPIAVLTSPATHYSISKACDILRIPCGNWEDVGYKDMLKGDAAAVATYYQPHPSGAGLHYIPCSADGIISTEELHERILWLHEAKKILRFIIVLNAGTTMTGASDDVATIGSMIRDLEHEWKEEENSCFHIHVDAAYGGFIQPFLDPLDQTRYFHEASVSTITLDPYKMGMCSLASGIFLCRQGLLQHVERPTGYVNNHNDNTLCGSRSAAPAAECFTVFRKYGTRGFQVIHQAAAKRAADFHQSLSNIGCLDVVKQHLNMVACYLPDYLSFESLRRIEEECIKPFRVMWALFHTNPSDPAVTPRRMMKFNITPTVKDEWLGDFQDCLSAIVG